MKLLQLTLTNFQGARNQTFDFPGGCSASIYGDNATGKTTLYNALTWLLFGKASTDIKSFSPKTRDAQGELHHLDHTVTAEFQTDAGQTTTLRKTFRENWKKKRGAAREDFDGHVVDYSVDGVPFKEKEYTATVAALCGGDMEKARALTAPDYFSERMDWQSRRGILLEICGDSTDEAVIASNTALGALPDFLRMPGTTDRYYQIDEYRKIVAARQKEINRDKTSIPARIDEANRAIPALADACDIGAVEQRITALQQQLQALTDERARAIAGVVGVSQVHEQLAAVRAQIAQGRAQYIEEQSQQNAAWSAQLLDRQHRAAQHRCAKEEAENKLRRAKESVERLIQKRDALMREWHEADGKKWKLASTLCPTCGQALPQDKIDQMRAEFHLKKSETLEQITQRGKAEASKEMLTQAQAEVERLEREVQATQSMMEAETAEVERLRNARTTPLPYESTEEYVVLTQQQNDLQAALANQNTCANQATAAIDANIASVSAALKQEQDKRAALTVAHERKQRIAELEAQEKALAAEYEKTEQGLYLCDLFTRTKVSLLTERINQKFRHVRFQLFTEQLNGGIKECCEVLVPAPDDSLIPYAYANNAARINAGLEIIDTLGTHWGTSMPVFVDNAESVTHLCDMHTQLIRLIVSEHDKTLRLEVQA